MKNLLLVVCLVALFGAAATRPASAAPSIAVAGFYDTDGQTGPGLAFSLASFDLAGASFSWQIGTYKPGDGNLTPWTGPGVELLNTNLLGYRFRVGGGAAWKFGEDVAGGHLVGVGYAELTGLPGQASVQFAPVSNNLAGTGWQVQWRKPL